VKGSARVSRAGDDVSSSRNFSLRLRDWGSLFPRDAETSTRDACATRSANTEFRLRAGDD